MTLPTSPPITWNQICTEFSLAFTSVWPAAFYGKGGAPSTGQLSFSDFLGRSATVGTVTPTPGTYTANDSRAAKNWSATSASSGTWTYTTTGPGVTVNQASGYVGTGVTATFALNSTDTLNLSVNVAGTVYSWTVTGSGTSGGTL